MALLLVMDEYACRTPAQKRAEAAYKALIADPEEADHKYDELPKTQGGSIISTDFARYLDPAYLSDSAAGRLCDLAPSWGHAWRYAQDRLERELARRGSRSYLRLMSGGWGSGKTFALESLKHESIRADLVWDGTLGDYAWAAQTVKKALKAGWQVLIIHVHRNVELALYGAIERAHEEGRHVPLAQLPGNHRRVQGVIRKLHGRFGHHPCVNFLLLHNTGTRQVRGNSLPLNLDAIASGGALYYSSNYENYHAKAADQIHPRG